MAKRLFRVDSGVNGGELVIGTVNADFVEYFVNSDESDLIDHISNSECDPDECDPDAPEIKDGFCAWTECDDIEHLSGVFADTEWSWVEITGDVEAGSEESMENEYEGEQFEPLHLFDREAYHEDNDSAIEEHPNHEIRPVLVYHSEEKGGMGCWFVETDGEDFNPDKFCFSSVSTSLAEIVEHAYYDKEPLECNQDWASTRGKGDTVKVGWMNMQWRDTLESWLDDEEVWEDYDSILEDS
jgi:hypothetical protein